LLIVNCDIEHAQNNFYNVASNLTGFKNLSGIRGFRFSSKNGNLETILFDAHSYA